MHISIILRKSCFKLRTSPGKKSPKSTFSYNALNVTNVIQKLNEMKLLFAF